MKKKRILLLSEGFGAGHTQAAHALAISLRRHSNNVRTRVMELASFLHPTVVPAIISAYHKALMKTPKLYGKLYRAKYDKMLGRFSQLALHRLFYRQAAEVIRHMRPDIIICTHPFPNAVIARLKRSGLTVPLCTVITDYDAHGAWISREANTYLVSTEKVKRKLLQHGIAPEQIKVTGIPVHPDFWTQPDRNMIRGKFGLKDMPTALVMGGGFGIVSQWELLEKLASWRDRVQLIFCLGKNEKLLAKLQENEQFRHENIRLLGFTKEVDQLMEVSDVLITKPGGVTCSEGMAKGIPMLFLSPIPGQEEENCQHFTSLGVADRLESLEDVDTWFDLLVNRYEEFLERRERNRTLAARYRPEHWTRAILQLVGCEEEPQFSPGLSPASSPTSATQL